MYMVSLKQSSFRAWPTLGPKREQRGPGESWLVQKQTWNLMHLGQGGEQCQPSAGGSKTEDRTVLGSKDKLESACGRRGWGLSGQKPRNSKHGNWCSLKDHYNIESTNGYKPLLDLQMKRKLPMQLNLCSEEMHKKDKMPNGNGILKKSCNPSAAFANLGHDLAGE